MPTSYSVFKNDIKEWFLKNVPTTQKILDIGPGEATYFNLLHSSGYRIDALEIYNPYIEKYSLQEKYDKVFLGDVRSFDFSNYDFVIIGDVLEHLSIVDSERLLNKLRVRKIQALIAVPYLMEQGEYDGNIYETHLQPDLTKEVIEKRYPDLKLIFANEFYGYYSLNMKIDKAYVLYATIPYLDTVRGCVESIRKFSNIPIYVYVMHLDECTVYSIEEAISINWFYDEEVVEQRKFIDRKDSRIYRILIERPKIIKDALKYINTVAYIDSDSVATKYIDTIFDMYPKDSLYPYFVKGIYDYLFIDGKGDLETPACKLFNVNQEVRECYRQSGYFVAGQNTISFLDEWIGMCNHPEVLNNNKLYAPYNEETILNVLLWKHNIQKGLPYIYVNGSIDTIDEIKKIGFTGKENHIRSWFQIPDKEEHLLFYHGEKNKEVMYQMTEKLNMNKKLKVLFLEPHISTGGGPQFCLKRIEALKKYQDVEIYVVEYQNYSDEYVVQKNKIKKIADHFYTLGENKHELMDIIKHNRIDIVHVDSNVEGFDSFNKMSDSLLAELFDNNRTWRIIETCHNIVFNPDVEKKYFPDAYAFCTPHHLKTFKNMSSYKEVIEYPIDDQHKSAIGIWDLIKIKEKLGFDPNRRMSVLNIGLWTPGKNQKEGLEIARQYPDMDFHFVGNQAPNFKEYWEPLMEDLPENVVVWGERNNTDMFFKAADIFMFNSTYECNPIVLKEAISYGFPIIAHNLPQYEGMYDGFIQDIDTDLNRIKRMYVIPDNNTSEIFAKKHVDLYNKVMNNKITMNDKKRNIKITQHFVDQPFLEITGESNHNYLVKFFDDNNMCIYENTIKSNHWIRLNRRWFTKWKVCVWEDNILIYENKLDLSKKRVFIVFESKSLGDTIAWMPYVEEFRKKHNCEVILSTFKNFLFEKVYSNIQFVEPGAVIDNLYALYRIGWFYDENKEPELCNTIPLQKAATNILGLDYEEIVPAIDLSIPEKVTVPEYSGKYVTIATNSTAECKFWTKENWQTVINYLVSIGYGVVNVSKESNPFQNCYQILNTSMENTMKEIQDSRFFIGLSSGLSWLAWAMRKPVIMISNFTEENHEFKCERPINTTVCHGCWNKKGILFDKGDWYWCPFKKNFECQKSITPEMIIDRINLMH